MPHSGLAVGGPKDGQILAHPTKRHEVKYTIEINRLRPTVRGYYEFDETRTIWVWGRWKF